MARWCKTCGRKVEDHSTKKFGKWICDLKLIGETPTGKRYNPDSFQRTKENNVRWVHRSRLELGKDLYREY